MKSMLKLKDHYIGLFIYKSCLGREISDNSKLPMKHLLLERNFCETTYFTPNIV